jgi:hypothetical protein
MERHVYWTETIQASVEDVVDVLRDLSSAILGPHISSSTDNPVHRLRAHFAGSDVSKQVEISHGKLTEFVPGTYRMHISWHATDHEDLYPVMVGELEFTGRSTHPALCEVAFLGHYKPPFGVLGAIGDRATGHRVAEQAVVGFVHDVCTRLDKALARSQPVAAPNA